MDEQVGAATCNDDDDVYAEQYTYIIGVNPAEYSGTITDIYFRSGHSISRLQVGMMELTSGEIGGDPESFDVGSGGDYATEIDLDSEQCSHLVSAVDFTAFSCGAGEYAAAYWDNGDVPYTSSQPGNTYSKSGYYLETDSQSYARQSGEEIQMYFVNTL